MAVVYCEQMEREAAELPLLALVYSQDSFSMVQLSAAAAGVCRLLWVVDTTVPAIADSRRLLKKLGVVVDVAGLDLDAMVELVAAHEPAGIAVFADSAQQLAASLAERLGLEFHAPDVVERLVDKVAQRTCLRDAGFAGPTFFRLPRNSSPEVIDALAESASYPLVVKPQRGAASRDVYLARDAAELREIAAESAEQDMIVESYLADRTPLADQEFADFVSVESVVLDAVVHHICITGRFPLAPPFRGSGMFIPTALDDDLTSEIYQLAGDAALAIGVRSGIMHTEIKLTPDGPCIIEVNGRVGGGVPDILRLLDGPPLVTWRMLLAVGEPLPLDRVRPFDRVGFYLWHQPPVGATAITAISGLEAVAELPGVVEVRLVRRPGDRVDWHEGGVGHVYGVGGVVADYVELVALRHQILDTASVTYS
jgi:biotin carboxylase